MQDGGVLPVTGFPQVSGTANEGHRKDDSIMMQNSSISFNTCIRSTAVVLGGYTFEACIFGTDQVRRDVGEVGVLGTVVVEVVVHVSKRNLTNSNPFRVVVVLAVSAMVVVHVRRGT